MRVLFYAIDGVGLGHINRLVCIANELKRLDDKARVLFVTNSNFLDFFYRYKLRFVKLPNDYDNVLSSPDDFDYAIPKHSNLSILSSIVEGFKPDSVVFDTHFPEEFLIECKQSGIATNLILREYDKQFIERFVHEGVVKYLDKIFVASNQTELPQIYTAVGPIVRKEKYKADIKSKYDIQAGKFNVLITAGGGGYPAEAGRFLQAGINACAGLKNKNLNIIVVAGPLFRQFSELKRVKGLRLVNYEPWLISLMQSVDLVITQAGYNTCNEILYYKVPAVVLPVHRDTEDQKARAYQLAKKGFCMTLLAWNEQKLKNMLTKLLANRAILREIKSNLNKLKLKNGAFIVAKSLLANAKPILELNNQSMTDVVIALRNKPTNLLKLKNFNARRLVLVLAYLKESGYNSIYIICDKPIGKEELLKLSSYPLVYVIDVTSLSRFRELMVMLKHLKELHLPFMVRIFPTSKGFDEIVSELIKLRAYVVQIITDNENSELIKLVNKRFAKENSLMDISLRTSEQFLPEKAYIIDKEIVELVNEIKAKQSALKRELQKAGIISNVKLLEQEIEHLAGLVKPREQDRVEELETKRFQILIKHRVAEKITGLEGEIKKQQSTAERLFNSQLKLLYEKLDSLFYQRYLLLKNSNLVDSLKGLEEKLVAIESKNSQLWQDYKRLEDELRDVKKQKSNMLCNNEHCLKISKLEDELQKISKRKDCVWNELQQIEGLISDLTNERETELKKLSSWRKVVKLKQKLSELDKKFNSIIKSEFEPVRKRINILQSKQRGREYQQLLKQLIAKRDKIWQDKLAAMELEKDIVSYRIEQLCNQDKIKFVLNKFKPKITKAEKKRQGLVLELEKLNSIFSGKKQKLAKLKSNKSYISNMSIFDIKLGNLEGKLKQLSNKIEKLNKEQSKVEKAKEAILIKKGIKVSYDKLNEQINRLILRISKISKKYDSAKAYLEFLKQERSYVLNSKGILNEISEIDSELAELYNTNDKIAAERKLRGLKNKLNLLLKQNNMFEKYYQLKNEIRAIEQKISQLKQY